MRFYLIFFLKKAILLIKFQAILIKMGDSEFLYVLLCWILSGVHFKSIWHVIDIKVNI